MQIRMGQANVKRWIDEIMPLTADDSDPLGTEDFVTHSLPLDEAPGAAQTFAIQLPGQPVQPGLPILPSPPLPQAPGVPQPQLSRAERRRQEREAKKR